MLKFFKWLFIPTPPPELTYSLNYICKYCHKVEPSGEITNDEHREFGKDFNRRHTKCLHELTGP